jgi:hypothetical protein
MSVSFRESIASGKSVGKAEEDRMVGTKRRFAKMSIAVEPLSFSSAGSDAQDTQDAQRIMHNEIDLSSISPHDDDDEGGGEERGASRVQLQASQCDAVRESIEQVLASGGPVAGYPVAGVRVTVLAQDCAFDEDSTPVAVASCAARAVRRALENGAMELLEPGKTTTTPTTVSLAIVSLATVSLTTVSSTIVSSTIVSSTIVSSTIVSLATVSLTTVSLTTVFFHHVLLDCRCLTIDHYCSTIPA